jgi:CPA1 family monovalent cation:H+ antiporter
VAKCEHLKQANPKVKPNSDVCQECINAGQGWMELRQCLVCGNVACCDSSPGRHATQHFKETGHAVMRAFKSGDWKWCYVHESYM